MILKEAYRYQNYLNTLIRDAESYLMKKDFITDYQVSALYVS